MIDHLTHLRQLRNDIASEAELRDFCFTHAAFRPVFDELKESDCKREIVRRILEQADHKGLWPPLLAWAKTQNPGRVEALPPAVLQALEKHPPPLDPQATAQQIIEIITPAEDRNPATNQVIAQIAQTVLTKLRQTPKGEVLAAGFSEDPETYHKPLVKELARAIEQSEIFTRQVTDLLQQYSQASPRAGSQATLTGLGVISQKSRLKAGKESVVGSSAGRNIITGDNTN